VVLAIATVAIVIRMKAVSVSMDHVDLSSQATRFALVLSLGLAVRRGELFVAKGKIVLTVPQRLLW
jgi:hypothetical protein